MRARVLATLLLAACDGSSTDVRRTDAGDVSPARDSALAPACVTWPGDRQWGTARDDRAGITVLPSGDVVLHGYLDGELGIDNVEPAGRPRGFIEQLAPKADAGWRWQLDAPLGGTIDAVLPRGDGTLLFTGRAREASNGTTRPQYQLVLGELDDRGRPLATPHVLGDLPSERPRQLASSNGHRVVAGYLDLYVPTNHVVSVEDPFVVTWRDGEMATARLRRFDTPYTDYVDGVALAPDGTILVAATARAGGSGSGSFVRRFDASGRDAGTTWIARGPLEALASIRRLPGGDVLVAGSTWSLFGSDAAGEDAFVARYDATLAERRWLTRIGSASSDRALDLAVADDGRAWVVGETLGSLDARPNRGQADVFVAALAADGTLRWISQVGSTGDERPSSIAVDACETVLVAGDTDGPLVPGVLPRSTDAFAVRVH